MASEERFHAAALQTLSFSPTSVIFLVEMVRFGVGGPSLDWLVSCTFHSIARSPRPFSSAQRLGPKVTAESPLR